MAALRAPGVDGAPFTGLFALGKALGTLSPRRVLKEVGVGWARGPACVGRFGYTLCAVHMVLRAVLCVL